MSLIGNVSSTTFPVSEKPGKPDFCSHDSDRPRCREDSKFHENQTEAVDGELFSLFLSVSLSLCLYLSIFLSLSIYLSFSLILSFFLSNLIVFYLDLPNYKIFLYFYISVPSTFSYYHDSQVKCFKYMYAVSKKITFLTSLYLYLPVLMVSLVKLMLQT